MSAKPAALSRSVLCWTLAKYRSSRVLVSHGSPSPALNSVCARDTHQGLQFWRCHVVISYDEHATRAQDPVHRCQERPQLVRGDVVQADVAGDQIEAGGLDVVWQRAILYQWTVPAQPGKLASLQEVHRRVGLWPLVDEEGGPRLQCAGQAPGVPTLGADFQIAAELAPVFEYLQGLGDHLAFCLNSAGNA